MYDWKQKAKALIRQQFGYRKEAEFAIFVGLEPAYLNHKLSGRRKATDKDIQIIAEGLGITPTELMADPEEFTIINNKHKIAEDDALYTINKIVDMLESETKKETLIKMHKDILSALNEQEE
jgi:transcriptional regulator with XRE-family HTH domain